ncbi:19240_t:CDS:2 [Entrophospora sp. SA101]|nr:19240_t:CDS:2 [Entrophospora sp. SA101]
MLDTQSDYFTPTTLANTSINTFTVTTPTSIDFNDQFENDDWKWEEGLRLIEEFAIWLDKTDQVWCEYKKKFIEKPLVVALKSLKNSQDLSEDFLDEIKRHGSLKLDGCQILSNIAMGLLDIHKNATFHKNLHCGNILKYSIFNIADFGLSGPSGTSNPKGVYGSLPLVAPEVLADEDSLNGLEDINDLNSFDEILNSHITNVRYPVAPDTHPFAIYTSDFLLFPNLPAPTNSIAISDPSEEKDEPISSSPPFFSINNSNFLDQVNLAFEEYDTNFPPPELSEPETDNEAEDEIFIPPPSFPIMRRKSIAPQPVF